MSTTEYIIHPGGCTECAHYEWQRRGGLSWRQCALTSEEKKFPGRRCERFAVKEGMDMRVVSLAHLEEYK